MELTLTRTLLSSTSTEGELSVDGLFAAYTLELPVKDGLPGSAIPPGTYPIVLAPSPKFLQVRDSWVQRYASAIPHIINIPNRTNILIHWGNDAADTEGCVLVGLTREQDFIGRSRDAFAALHAKLLLATDPIHITVVGGIVDVLPAAPDASLLDPPAT
jgi:hypothetical protein